MSQPLPAVQRHNTFRKRWAVIVIIIIIIIIIIIVICEMFAASLTRCFVSAKGLFRDLENSQANSMSPVRKFSVSSLALYRRGIPNRTFTSEICKKKSLKSLLVETGKNEYFKALMKTCQPSRIIYNI